MDINKILKKLKDSGRYERGYTYYKQRRVKDPLVNENVIIAEVVGTDNYQVKIFLDKGDVSCTCPDGAGYCKHVIAVMLAYKNNKKSFSNARDIFSDLRKKNKDELISIIKQMYLNKITLNDLLKIQNSKIKNIKVFSKDLYGVDDLFGEYVDYYEIQDLLKKLDSLMILALDCKEKNDFNASFAILWSLIRTISYKIGDCDDSNGQVGEFFFECIEELSGIINKVIVEKNMREKFFNECFKIWKETDFGIDGGVLDLVRESIQKDDISYLSNKIDFILKENSSKYFEEYVRSELKELKKSLLKKWKIKIKK